LALARMEKIMNQPIPFEVAKTTICIDDSYTFLFETLIRVFENENPDAHVTASVKNESDAITALLNDSCKVIVLNRELTKKRTKGI
jgi:hypothetical protein